MLLEPFGQEFGQELPSLCCLAIAWSSSKYKEGLPRLGNFHYKGKTFAKSFENWNILLHTTTDLPRTLEFTRVTFNVPVYHTRFYCRIRLKIGILISRLKYNAKISIYATITFCPLWIIFFNPFPTSTNTNRDCSKIDEEKTYIWRKK